MTRANREDLMLFYNLAAFADKDTNAFLSGVARANDLVKKVRVLSISLCSVLSILIQGGVLDVAGAARIVLRDWSTGKLPRYTVPAAKTSTSPADSSLSDIYAQDDEVLTTLTPRKELRKSSGLVKLVAGSLEDRRVDLEASWLGSGESEDEGEEDEASEDEDENDSG